MKVLIVTQYFWPENFKINDFAIGLIEKGHTVTVLTGRPNYPIGRFFTGYSFFNRRIEYYERIKIIRSYLISRGNGGGLRLFFNYFSFAFFASLGAIFRLKKNSDVIFVYEPSPITVGIPAIIYKLFTKAPIFFWVQDLWPESLTAAGNVKSKFILKIINSVVKFIYRNSDIIFISSRSFLNSIVEKGIGEFKIKYLPNWAEDLFLNEVENSSLVSELFPQDGFNVLFAGNIGDAQDFESIIKTICLTKEYKKINWIILGDGRKKMWVEQKKAELNLENIFLLGRFPNDKMPYFFKEADVLLVTLKNENIFSLTVPAKIQSYLASGKPILAMINGEGAEIIAESKAGFAVPAGDYKKLAEKVVEMYLMPKEKLEELALSGKSYYAEKFNRKKLIDDVLNEFNSLVSN